MDDGRTLIDERNWDWSLYRLPGGELLLSVVCGSVGLFEVEVVLDESQCGEFEGEGIAAVERLAADIRYSPRKYIKG